MEFYNELTKLLRVADNIEKFENLKKINYSEKEKEMKNFIILLKSVLNYKIESKENKNFRIYFIEYLKNIITSSLSFCTSNDKNEIEYLIKSIKQNNNIKNDDFFSNNYNNDNNIEDLKIDDIKNKKSENYEILQNNINHENNYDLSNERNNIFINIKEEKGFYPKNYKKNDENKENEDKILKNNNLNFENLNSNKLNHDEESNNNLDNEKLKYNEDIFNNIKDNIHFNNYEINENKKYINKNNNDENKKKIKNNKKNNFNNLNHQVKNLNNYNFIDLNSNNNINNNINDLANMKDKSEIQNNKINENNNYKEKEKEKEKNKEIQINKIINENIHENINEKNNDQNNHYFKANNKCINNNNENNDKNSIKEKDKMKKNNPNGNNKKKNNINPAAKFEEKIDIYYKEILNDNVAQFFIKLIMDKNNNQNNNQNNFNTICTKIFMLVENNKIEYIEQKYKEELTTLICALYYFAKSQRSKIDSSIFNSTSPVDKHLFDYLKKNILLQNNSKTIDFNINKVKKFTNDFCKDLFLDNQEDGKYDIFSGFTFLVIARYLRDCCPYGEKYYYNFNELLKKEYLISFKIHFILEHQEFYKAISDDFIEIYHGLYFINLFYKELFNDKNKDIIITKDNKIGNYIFGKEKYVLSFDQNCDFDISKLFSELDNKIYNETMEKIEYFYSIKQNNSNDIYDLIYYSTNKIGNKESNIILNIVEHIYEKMIYIYDNFEGYKQNLINLEKIIFDIGKKTFKMNKDIKEIKNYSIDITKKLIFGSLLYVIDEQIVKNEKQFKGKYKLYPLGSITQFLGGGNSSDIDIYLDIRLIKTDKDKINFLYLLEKIIKSNIDGNCNTIISSRLCVISFRYNCFKGVETKFDVSLMGLCPYIHSIILRSYSLIDPRFSLLAVSLKKFLKNLGFKDSNVPLNSFSWMILLITFLQDIIKPQILPKILSDKNNSIINIEISYGNNYGYKRKNLKCFVESIKQENRLLPDCIFDNKSLYKKCKEQLVKSEKENKKNNLTCAELFLYSLEFIIYYFKNDSVYVNCSIENEGYENIYCILNNNEQNTKSDEKFQEYFKYKYYNSKNYTDNKKTKDGFILIRDPIDPHYNPGQSLKSGKYNYFIEQLKDGYLKILKGEFQELFQ